MAAASYAADHDLSGMVLLASYPTKKLDEPMLLIYGSENGILNKARVEEAGKFGEVETAVINGGNHAGFGNYGIQKGDAASLIGADAQQLETVRLIMDWVGRVHSEG